MILPMMMTSFLSSPKNPPNNDPSPRCHSKRPSICSVLTLMPP
jgi:hypothetical protein